MTGLKPLQTYFKVSAYANDITVGMGPEDISVVCNEIKCYKQASGACFNLHKSKLLVLHNGAVPDEFKQLQKCQKEDFIDILDF